MKRDHQLETIVAGMYLMGGAEQSPHAEVAADNNGGNIGLACVIAEYAPLVTDFLYQHTNESTDWPGVFEYEVVEPLGRWMAERLAFSTSESIIRETFVYELRERFNVFMSQMEPPRADYDSYAGLPTHAWDEGAQ